MRIHDFDCELKISEIKKKYLYVKRIKEKIADNRSEFRAFSEQIALESEVLFDCIDKYETTLLIDCYTYVEQITKALVYELLGKDNNENIFIETFIMKKLNPEKFSPNVKFKKLSENINDVYSDFKFILTEIEEIKFYDELIRSRHRYAHTGNYDFYFDNYSKSIDMLEYITHEFKLIMNPAFKRNKFLQDYNNILKVCNSLIKKKEKGREDSFVDVRKAELISEFQSLDKDLLIENKLLLREVEFFESKLESI